MTTLYRTRSGELYHRCGVCDGAGYRTSYDTHNHNEATENECPRCDGARYVTIDGAPIEPLPTDEPIEMDTDGDVDADLDVATIAPFGGVR